MKPRQLQFIIAPVAFGLVGGVALGHVQDDLTQWLAGMLGPFAIVFYGSSVLAWCVATLWYALAWRHPEARRFGVEPSLTGLVFVLAWCPSTIAGAIVFFLVNGTDYMTIPQVASYAALAGVAYNFWLVALPLLVMSVVRAAWRRSGRVTARVA